MTTTWILWKHILIVENFFLLHCNQFINHTEYSFSNFASRASYVLMKDYIDKHAFFIYILCTDESITKTPWMCIKKVNRGQLGNIANSPLDVVMVHKLLFHLIYFLTWNRLELNFEPTNGEQYVYWVDIFII